MNAKAGKQVGSQCVSVQVQMRNAPYEAWQVSKCCMLASYMLLQHCHQLHSCTVVKQAVCTILTAFAGRLLCLQLVGGGRQLLLLLRMR